MVAPMGYILVILDNAVLAWLSLFVLGFMPFLLYLRLEM
jgi:hypothetical protein